MEIIKNLNDSEETIFLQAIDQNYIKTTENSNQRISQYLQNEDSSYSDFEEYNKNINFNFIEFNDDSNENSPNSKNYSNNENYCNSVFSNESTEAENNLNIPSIKSADGNYSSGSPNIIRKSSVGNDDNKNHINFIDENNLKFTWNFLKEKKFEEKDFSVNFQKVNFKELNISENYALEEKTHLKAKVLINPIKAFLTEEFSNELGLEKEISKIKEKLRKELNNKLISQKKYLDYINFYNRNVASGNFLPSNPPYNLATLNINPDNSLVNNLNLNNSNSFLDNNNKSNEIISELVNQEVNKSMLSLNCGVFISGSSNNNFKDINNNINNNLENKNLKVNQQEQIKCRNYFDLNINNKRSAILNSKWKSNDTVKNNYDDDEPNITLSNFIIISKKTNKKKKYTTIIKI
jgi:hypothetical protein